MFSRKAAEPAESKKVYRLKTPNLLSALSLWDLWVSGAAGERKALRSCELMKNHIFAPIGLSTAIFDRWGRDINNNNKFRSGKPMDLKGLISP